ncbi:hypothetical protein F5B21DRAFT_9207 [Xylaria acuta]|nr:hypothetical protein F5B21DRAFT_9207 [Xylaria acuta]
MVQHMIFLLSIWLASLLPLAGVLAAPGRNYIANSENDIIVSDNFKEPASSSSHMVAVTVTTIETAIVDTIVVPDILNGSITTTVTSGTATNDQHETVTITYTAEPGTDVDASTDTTSLSINTATPLQHAGSTSSLLQIINTDSAKTTSATITAVGSSTSSTSAFDNAICDDIFCNTDGNKICIYWGGMTSWDVSLGPIPGERPTIIGTC